MASDYWSMKMSGEELVNLLIKKFDCYTNGARVSGAHRNDLKRKAENGTVLGTSIPLHKLLSPGVKRSICNDLKINKDYFLFEAFGIKTKAFKKNKIVKYIG